jgi:hypothetical protein
MTGPRVELREISTMALTEPLFLQWYADAAP